VTLTLERPSVSAFEIDLSPLQFGSLQTFAPTEATSSGIVVSTGLQVPASAIDWDLLLKPLQVRKYASTGVVWWFNLESIERYESEQDFVDRLRSAAETSTYAARLLFLLEEQSDDFTPIAYQAARRAWDVLSKLPRPVPRVRVFPGADGSIDLQLRRGSVVRLLTAGSDGIFESREVDRVAGSVERHVLFGPTDALKFLLTGDEQ
jgi:hypothetical protein